MYKELIISIIIIILIFVGDKITTNYLNESMESISYQLSDLKERVNNEEEEIKESDIDKIYNEWKQRYEKLAYYVEHDELEKEETNLIAIKSNIETCKKEEIIEKIDEAKFILEHIKNKYTLNLKNIF